MRSSPAVLETTPRRNLYCGRDLDRAITIEDLRAMAHRRLPSFVLEYLEGGAEEEATLARNLAAFAQWRFVPRALADVSKRSTAASVLGRGLPMPLVVAPTGLNNLFWPHADLALAEAAAEIGIPFVQSTMSNTSMAQIAAVPSSGHWWQLYVFGPASVSKTLIARACAAGCDALVVTTDTQIYGNREWDRRNRTAPGKLTWRAKLDAALHLRWLITTLLRPGMPCFENIIEFVPADRRSFFDSAFWVRAHMDLSLTWDSIARLRDLWPQKFLVKGLLSVADVSRAMKIGADGVVLSNHGGRQLDWTLSPLEILPEAKSVAAERMAVLVDGGVRRGTDVVKALALGADAVLVGRAVLYGVAAGGKAGAARALAILHEELARTLGLLNVPSIDALGPDLIARA
jgi:(S)-mandelate dehydrogenase